MSSIWTTPTETDPALRVQDPNSEPRDMLVVALDPTGGAYGEQFAHEPWKSTVFVGFAGMGDAAGAPADWAGAMDERPYDVVVMVAAESAPADLVDQIGARCAGQNIKVGVIIVGSEEEGGDAVDANLRVLRPWADTLAIINEAPAMIDMLHGLGG